MARVSNANAITTTRRTLTEPNCLYLIFGNKEQMSQQGRASFNQNNVETLKTALLSHWTDARLWKQALGSVKWGSHLDQIGSDVEQLRFVCSLVLAYCMGGEFDQLERSPVITKEELSRIYQKAQDLVEDPELLPLLEPVTRRIDDWNPPAYIPNSSTLGASGSEEPHYAEARSGESPENEEVDILRAVNDFVRSRLKRRRADQPPTSHDARTASNPVPITSLAPPSTLAKDPGAEAGSAALRQQVDMWAAQMASMKAQVDSLVQCLTPSSGISTASPTLTSPPHFQMLPSAWSPRVAGIPPGAVPVGQTADVPLVYEPRKAGQVYLPRCFTRKSMDKKLSATQAELPQHAAEYIRASWEIEDLLEKEPGFVEREYHQYTRWIVGLSDNHDWGSVMTLDEKLRSQHAVGKFQWKERPYDMLWAFLRSRPDQHRTDSKLESKSRIHGAKKKKGVCWGFNGHKGCARGADACDFTHACSDCKSLNHGVLNCNSGPKGHPGKTSSSGTSTERRE